VKLRLTAGEVLNRMAKLVRWLQELVICEPLTDRTLQPAVDQAPLDNKTFQHHNKQQVASHGHNVGKSAFHWHRLKPNTHHKTTGLVMAVPSGLPRSRYGGELSFKSFTFDLLFVRKWTNSFHLRGLCPWTLPRPQTPIMLALRAHASVHPPGKSWIRRW